MKKYILVVLAAFFALPLFSQGIITGTWKGEFKKNGKTYKYYFKGGQEGEPMFGLPDMRLKGKFERNGQILMFKNSDGILRLRRLSSESQFRNKRGYLRFKGKKRTISYKYVSGPIALPGWDEGVAAVVVNHEEQY